MLKHYLAVIMQGNNKSLSYLQCEHQGASFVLQTWKCDKIKKITEKHVCEVLHTNWTYFSDTEAAYVPTLCDSDALGPCGAKRRYKCYSGWFNCMTSQASLPPSPDRPQCPDEEIVRGFPYLTPIDRVSDEFTVLGHVP